MHARHEDDQGPDGRRAQDGAQENARERRVNNRELRRIIRKAETTGKVWKWPPAADLLELIDALVRAVFSTAIQHNWRVSLRELKHEGTYVKFLTWIQNPAPRDDRNWRCAFDVVIDLHDPLEDIRYGITPESTGPFEPNLRRVRDEFHASLENEIQRTIGEWRLAFSRRHNLDQGESDAVGELDQTSSPGPVQLEVGSSAPKGGRPRIADDDWAFYQVHFLKRPADEVYHDWLKRIGERREALANPRDSFNKAIRLRRRREK